MKREIIAALVILSVFLLLGLLFLMVKGISKSPEVQEYGLTIPLTKISIPKERVRPNYPHYVEQGTYLRIYSGDRIEITGLSGTDFKVADIRLISETSDLKARVDLKKKTETSLITESIPRDLPSGRYTLKVITENNEIYTTKGLEIFGFREEIEKSYTSSAKSTDTDFIIYQKNVNCNPASSYACYWELALASNPSDPDQIILGNTISKYSLDGGLTWNFVRKNNANVGFRGDPKYFIREDGTVVFTGIEFTDVEKEDGTERRLTTGAIYTGKIGEELKGNLLKEIPSSYSGFQSLVVDRPTIAYDKFSGTLFISAFNRLANDGRGGVTIFITTDFKNFIEKDLPSGTVFQQFDTNEDGNPRAVRIEGEISRFIRTNPEFNSLEFLDGPEVLGDAQSISTALVCDSSDKSICPDRTRINLYWRGPEIKYDKNPSSPHFGRVHLVWAQANEKKTLTIEDSNGNDLTKTYGFNYDIYYSYSDDDGESWEPTIKVNNDKSSADQSFPSLSVDSEGTAHVAFHDKRNNPNSVFFDVYYAPIKNGRVKTNVKVNRQPIANPYGGRDHGDYLDYISAYPDKVYIAYPCMTDFNPNLPSDVCITALDPRVMYEENVPPEFSSDLEDKKVLTGENLKFNVSSFDPNGDLIELSSSLENGDPPSTIGASFTDNGDGTGVFSWTPSSEQDGTYQIKFTASDNQLQNSQLMSIVVTSRTSQFTSCSDCAPKSSYPCSREECESIGLCYAVETHLTSFPIGCLACEDAVSCEDYGSDGETCRKNLCSLNGKLGCVFTNGLCENCADNDGDGVCDQIDNCPSVYNPEQADLDMDSYGDFCDLDTCGDNFVSLSTEECDDGSSNSDTTPNACRNDCTLPECSDGILDSGEECDDNNLENGDGCSSSCELEPGFVCDTSSPSICEEITSCEECDSQLTGFVCQRNVCDLFNKDSCYFLDSPPSNSCVSCSEAEECSDYGQDSTTCRQDPCSVGPCQFESNICKSLPGTEKQENSSSLDNVEKGNPVNPEINETSGNLLKRKSGSSITLKKVLNYLAITLITILMVTFIILSIKYNKRINEKVQMIKNEAGRIIFHSKDRKDR